ncbi:MAG TPA: class I SAM-dependent methyltransferase, partial [Thermoanaerobaculia bacterium]
MLVCPLTHQLLRRVALADAERDGGRFEACDRTGSASRAVGRTDEVMLREDGLVAYPIVRRVPILLAPELLARGSAVRTFDLQHPHYAEAYQEMEFYNESALNEGELAESEAMLRPMLALSAAERARFPEPLELWVDAVYDAAAQYECYDHLAPVTGQVAMQLGGKGLHTVKLILAGAREGWLLTPMVGEATWAIALATRLGVADRLRVAVGIAEELPFADRSIDAIYSGGCVHHMSTGSAFKEISRILAPGGRFAAAEPWKTPWYAAGVAVFGKREANAFCRPLTRERLAPLDSAFDRATV